MEHTSNYNLSQWAGEDRILREDFNADNAKIEAALANAGNCKIKVGSYVGTGAFGKQTPNTVVFNEKPVLVFISGPLSMTALHGSPNGSLNSGSTATVSWQDNSISWYSVQSVANQLNVSGTTYYYVALVQTSV